MLRRRRAPATVQAVGMSALVDQDGGARITVTRLQLDVDRAYEALRSPYVAVRAVSWRLVHPTPWTPTWTAEVNWLVVVMGLVEAEVRGLFNKHMIRLRKDIAAGRIQQGTHDDSENLDPFGRTEAQLEAYRRAVLADLEPPAAD